MYVTLYTSRHTALTCIHVYVSILNVYLTYIDEFHIDFLPLRIRQMTSYICILTAASGPRNEYIDLENTGASLSFTILIVRALVSDASPSDTVTLAIKDVIARLS